MISKIMITTLFGKFVCKPAFHVFVVGIFFYFLLSYFPGNQFPFYKKK